jgi:hypothetical protein
MEKPSMIETERKLEALQRARAALQEVVADLEKTLGSEEALIVAAGAMRSLSAVERLARRIAREAGSNG